MYGCESWTVKKAERRRMDAFELWCWRRLLRVLWTARRFNQSILKEISPEYSLEGLMLKLKLQYFGHLMWRADPDAGKNWGQEEKEETKDGNVGWHHQLNGHEFEQTPGDSKERDAWHAAVHGISKSQTWLSSWTTITTTKQKPLYRGEEYCKWTEYFNRENKQQTRLSGKKYQLIQRQEREIIQSRGAKCLKKNRKEGR